ncbi:MAG: DinB family protein [Rhodothermales bacterium]
MTWNDVIADFRETVERSAATLLKMSDADSARHPAPGAWSPKEIIGHLIDSASNNHQRFVRALFQNTLIFPGYGQDAWVRAQRYQDAPWPALITLWRSYNLHLARVMESVPEETRMQIHRRHNFHQIAWQTVPEDEPTTLDYFMRDYVAHLKHHLRQILPS